MNIWCGSFWSLLLLLFFLLLFHQWKNVRYSAYGRNWKFSGSGDDDRRENWENIYQKNVSMIRDFFMLSLSNSSIWVFITRLIYQLRTLFFCKVSEIVSSKQTVEECQEWLCSPSGRVRVYEYLLRNPYHWTVPRLVDWVSVLNRLVCLIHAIESQVFIFSIFSFSSPIDFSLLVVVVGSLSFFSLLLFTFFLLANWRHKLLTQHPPDAEHIFNLHDDDSCGDSMRCWWWGGKIIKIRSEIQSSVHTLAQCEREDFGDISLS